jgi:hypothetical protein
VQYFGEIENNSVHFWENQSRRASLGDKGMQDPLQKDPLDLALFEREKPCFFARNAAYRRYQGRGEVCEQTWSTLGVRMLAVTFCEKKEQNGNEQQIFWRIITSIKGLGVCLETISLDLRLRFLLAIFSAMTDSQYVYPILWSSLQAYLSLTGGEAQTHGVSSNREDTGMSVQNTVPFTSSGA